MDSDQRRSIIEIWKTVVEVQQHFNEIGMKIRSLFITIVVAIAAAQGFLLGKGMILFATLMPVFGIVATFLFYFIDRFWYHQLLKGAEEQGKMIEGKYKDDLPELCLGAKISEYSPIQLEGGGDS